MNKLSQIANLKTKMVEMIDFCHPRISQLYVDCYYVSADLLQLILPRLKDLEMMEIVSTLGVHHNSLFQNMINNNSSGLKNLNFCNLTITDFIFNDMSNLTEIKLIDCKGNTGIHSLLSRATNLKKLSLRYMNLDALVASTCNNLKELELVNCQGEISALINQSAQSLVNLILIDTDLDSMITDPLLNLHYLKLEACRGEICSLLRQAAPIVRRLVLSWIDMETQVVTFNNLQSVNIQSRELDISQCALLRREGTLNDFFK